MQVAKLNSALVFVSSMFLSSNISGQTINRYCEDKVDSLIRSGIDTVIYYQPYIGPMVQEANDCCMIYERQYLLWRKGQQIFVLKHYDYYDIDKNTKGKR